MAACAAASAVCSASFSVFSVSLPLPAVSSAITNPSCQDALLAAEPGGDRPQQGRACAGLVDAGSGVRGRRRGDLLAGPGPRSRGAGCSRGGRGGRRGGVGSARPQPLQLLVGL